MVKKKDQKFILSNILNYAVMKKIIFTILLSIFTLTSYAQNDSLYVDGMKWVCGYFYFADKDSVRKVYERIYTYVINGDTLINNTNYKKMLYSYRRPEMDYDKYWCMYFCRYENGKYLFYLPNGESMDEENNKGYECVFFDENLKPGNTELEKLYGKIAYIADTVFDCSLNPRRYWKLQPDESASSRYRYLLDYVAWVEGIGSLSQPIPYFYDAADCPCYNALLYCINPAGDTIYRNQKYIDLVEPYFKTDIPALKSSAVSFSQRGGECVVTLPYDASAWSATLFNSSGAAVARRSGEGSEIILPATSKGTHILVVNADGRAVKKKVFIK